jgi:hypothetical protein
VETAVRRRIGLALCSSFLLVWLAPATARAQSAPEPASAAPAVSDFWLVGGTAFVAVLGDCRTCEEEFPYRHGGGVLAAVGHRVNQRMDVGAELFWVPTSTAGGRLRTTHVDAVAQFRPWSSRGFFVKGGAGMAFVRNWVDAIGTGSINSKALSVVVGAGWAFRPAARVGLQLFGAQHAAALGDLQTADGQVSDVMGNYWSLGVALVVR